MNHYDLQDLAIRALFLIAGSVAGVLLVLKGQGQSLPALAAGGVLGAFLMRFGTSESEE